MFSHSLTGFSIKTHMASRSGQPCSRSSSWMWSGAGPFPWTSWRSGPGSRLVPLNNNEQHKNTTEVNFAICNTQNCACDISSTRILILLFPILKHVDFAFFVAQCSPNAIPDSTWTAKNVGTCQGFTSMLRYTTQLTSPTRLPVRSAGLKNTNFAKSCARPGHTYSVCEKRLLM